MLSGHKPDDPRLELYIGRVYEYFLKEFAVNATKEEGEFYTPHDVVQLIAMMIEPYDGTLYDPWDRYKVFNSMECSYTSM